MNYWEIVNPPDDIIFIDKETEDRLVAAVSEKFDTLPLSASPYENKHTFGYKKSIITNLRTDQVSQAASLLNTFVGGWHNNPHLIELQDLLEEYDDDYDHQEMASSS